MTSSTKGWLSGTQNDRQITFQLRNAVPDSGSTSIANINDFLIGYLMQVFTMVKVASYHGTLIDWAEERLTTTYLT